MISVGEEALVLIPPNDTEMDFISSCETETSSLSLQENNAIPVSYTHLTLPTILRV